MATQFTLPRQVKINVVGRPYAGAQLFFYQTGTDNLQTTYQDAALTTPHPQPIIADDDGYFPVVWLNTSATFDYRAVVLSASGLQLEDINNIPRKLFTSADIGATLDSLRVTASETAAGLAPANFAYPPGDSRRVAPETDGTVDVTDKLQSLLDAAGKASEAADGQVTEVVLYPGIYRVKRLYMRYSNVWLRLMPGAIIQQNRTGIDDSNTTGVAPAYAVIHVNPIGYVASPSSAVTAITNVKIYGGGIVKGPYTTTGIYDTYSMGIVANDCQNFVLDGIKVMNCRAENILVNPSGWNTVAGCKLLNFEVEGGGEVGINNARAFEISGFYVHDSWMQNGLGGNGDGGVISRGVISNMYQGGMALGGSGAADIDECRNVIVSDVLIYNTGLGSTAGYALFLTDDGATTVPKKNITLNNIIVSLHHGTAVVGCSLADASGVIDIDGLTITGGVSGSPGVGFAVISGAATYNLRNCTIYPGFGNQDRGVDILGGAPVVNVLDGNRISGHATADIQGPTDFALSDDYGSFTGTLTGCTTSPTGTAYYARRRSGKHVTLLIPSITGTSNSTAATITGLPAALWPARSQNVLVPISDNGSTTLGIVQIMSNGTMTLFKDVTGGAFTNSGTKGTTGTCSVSYVLN